MALGVTFGIKRPDGDLPVVKVDADGAVAAAGGRVGDVWLTVDGEPVIAVFEDWLDGTRVRSHSVPIIVRFMRAGIGLTIAVIDGPEASGADDGADLAEETPIDESLRSESAGTTLPPITLRDRLRGHLGKAPLDADTEALLRRDDRPRWNPHSAVNGDERYDPFASRGSIERFWTS
jgi:hypothetical protein